MWHITIGHPAITARFFVALDALDRTCLVDEPGRALSFECQDEAESFARANCIDDDWAVARA